MRSWACRFGIALLALALAPLAGFGSRAQAGYLVHDPALRSAILGNDFADNAADMSGAATGQDQSYPQDQKHPDGNGPQSPSPTTRLTQAHHLWMGLGQSGAGAGSVPSPSAGGSALYAAVGLQLAPPPVHLAGWLYIDKQESRPPPFPSRLFRPPRTASC